MGTMKQALVQLYHPDTGSAVLALLTSCTFQTRKQLVSLWGDSGHGLKQQPSTLVQSVSMSILFTQQMLKQLITQFTINGSDVELIKLCNLFCVYIVA